MSVIVNLNGCMSVCVCVFILFSVCGAGGLFPDVDKQSVNEENKKMGEYFRRTRFCA